MNISFNQRDHDGPILAEVSSCVNRIVQVVDAWTSDDEHSRNKVSLAWKQSPEDNRTELLEMIHPLDRSHFVELADYFWSVTAKRKCPIQIKAVNFSPITYLIYLVIFRAKLDVKRVADGEMNDDDMRRLLLAVGDLAKCDIHTYDCRYFDYILPKLNGACATMTI
jgi:hypothetical protein